MAKTRIPWHAAFFEAIQLELEQFRDVLEFQAEYPLTSEPLQIDVVIIKKTPGAVIEKNIACIFRQINLVEFKSPDDYFSVSDFYKVLGYVFFYASLNAVSVREMTVTIVESRYPRELFRHAGKGTVQETSPGIYRISGYPVDIQVIESRKLPPGENLWLRGLAKDLNIETAGAILKESRKRGKGARFEAYLHAVFEANIPAVEEVLRMAKNKKKTLDQVLEETGLTAKWEARGEKRGKAIGEASGIAQGKESAWKKALELMKQGYTVDQLEQMTP
ncbi:MAG: hypothetical protein LBI67_10420 [Treponema sp.]|jgi:hypothetical protein|nr:hypothetical protein [Treponema sp.]